MSKFTDRLWRDIVREHGHELAALDSQEPSPSHRLRSRLLAGTGVSLAGIGAGVALLVGLAGSAPAYAISHNQDGTYTIRLHSLKAIPAANEALHRLNVRAEVVPVTAACAGSVTLWKNANVPDAMRRAQMLASQARLDPRRVASGTTIV